ncbi:hypothetical protein NLI96_g1799 [Meripilus lineatus]|uniref:Uncharacterized protein n=1 Tax=Meripilus lineatus TaxID=2056292 RepID=A0AAD5V9Y6_9APHY|nr:hypothetical protein NLI96_g1799 [Physisporinus lineatus]
MPDWNSAAELATDLSAFMKMVHGVSGFYLWEVALSLSFEWAFIKGLKKFTWPALFYFLGRYAAIATVVGTLVSIDAASPLKCQPLYTFLALVGQLTIGFAAINLALRVMAMWSMRMTVVAPLVALILGHWAVLLQGVIISATWVPGTGCSVTKTNHSLLMVSFTYTAVFMVVLLVLVVIKLMFVSHKRPSLADLMFYHGLQYYIIALLANIPPAVLLALNLNPIMNAMFSFPSGIVFIAAACRSLRQLSDRKPENPSLWDFPFTKNPEADAVIFSSVDPSKVSSSLVFKSGEREPAAGGISLGTNRRGDGVHVQMDTYIVEDNLSEYEANKKPQLGNDSGDEHAL